MRKITILLLLTLLVVGVFPTMAQDDATPAPPTALIDALANALSGGSGSGSGGGGSSVSGSQRIEYTQEVVGTLSVVTPSIDYTFRGQAGDVISLTVSSNFIESYVQLYNASDPYYSLASGYGYIGSTPARIGGFVLPQTGDYIVRVNDYYGTNYGDFTLSLEKVEVTALAYGDSASATIKDLNDVAYFSFQAAAGDIITATVVGDGTLDTIMSIHDPTGYELTYMDNSVGLDPVIENYVLNQEGTYMILISPSSYGTTYEGEFELTLKKAEPLVLEVGGDAETLNFSYNKSRDLFSFEGEGGTTVRINMSLVSGNTTMSPNLTITQNGVTVAYSSGTYVTENNLAFVIPNDGIVYVQFDEYSYTDVGVKVSIEEVK